MMTISEGLRRIRNVHNMCVGRVYDRCGQMGFAVSYPEDKGNGVTTVWEDIEDAVINAGRMRRVRAQQILRPHSLPMRA